VGNVTWGDDLTQANLVGAPLACNSSSELMTGGCDAEYALSTESATKGYIGGAFSVLATGFAMVSLVLGLAVLAQQRASEVELDVIRFRKGLSWAALAALVAVFMEITTIAVFMSSPLFDNLGDTFGCKFVFSHALNSNPLKCHALGPSFGLAVGGCLLCVFACAMFYLAFKDPHYMDPETGRYSMFQEALLGARPLDSKVRLAAAAAAAADEADEAERRELLGRAGLDASGLDASGLSGGAGFGADGGAGGGAGVLAGSGHASGSEGSAASVPAASVPPAGGRGSAAGDARTHGAAGAAARKRKSARVAGATAMTTLAAATGSGSGSGSGPRGVAYLGRLYCVPVLLLLNAGLFVWSNCSTGATVEPHLVIKFPWELRWIGHKVFPGQVDADGVVAIKDDVFNFTLITSLRHFWEGQAYALAVLIGVFSGMWPYVKLLTMMVLWFVPSTEKLRGKLLHWLDVMGKWSLIDANVMCLMAVSFGFDTDTEVMGIGIHVDIKVRPGWGVYSFVLATMASLSMSHYMTTLHSRAMERRELSAPLLDAMERPPHEALMSRAYAPFARRRRYACSRLGQAAVWLVLSVTLAVNLLGMLFGTFEFKFSGLANLILPPEKRNTTYSIVSLGARLPEACSKGGFLSNGAGWGYFMTIMYFLFAMVVPLFMLVALVVLWAVPMTLSSTKRVFHLCQIVQSWAALDVLLVSLIAAVVEIGGLSASVLGDAFGSQQAAICKLLKALPRPLLNAVLKAVGLPPLDSELDECMLFRVDASLLDGCWMLVYSVAAWGICTHLIMEFAAASIDERTRVLMALVRKSEGGLDDDEDNPIDPYELLRIVNTEGDQQQQQQGRADANVEPARQHLLQSGAHSDSAGAVEAAGASQPGGARQTRRASATSQRLLRHTTGGTVESAELDEFEDENVDSSFRHSVYLKKILKAQEEGARLFMGTYFGDCMYGPFPRVWYPLLSRAGILYKVNWNQVGFDVHALMLMNVLSDHRFVEQTDDAAGIAPRPGLLTRRVSRGHTEWEPRSPFTGAEV
jgi:hypothetical protein